jgi:hypothetical protein
MQFQARPYQLDCHLLLELFIFLLGAVHGTHAARADSLRPDIGTDPAAG